VLGEHAERASVLVEVIDDEAVVGQHRLEQLRERGQHAVGRDVVAQRHRDGCQGRGEVVEHAFRLAPGRKSGYSRRR